ncbi:ribosomal protein L7/L12 [Streptomyces sp. NPDC017676]
MAYAPSPAAARPDRGRDHSRAAVGPSGGTGPGFGHAGQRAAEPGQGAAEPGQGAAEPGQGRVVEEPEFTVLLTGVGERRRDVVQALRAVTGLSAWRSAQLMAAAPVPAVEGTWLEAAVRAAARLRGAGAEVEVVCGGCARTLPRGGPPPAPGPCAARHWSASECRASRS